MTTGGPRITSTGQDTLDETAFEPTIWAAAVDGDAAALVRCLALDRDGEIARGQRLAAALALRATELGPTADLSAAQESAFVAWRSRLRQVAAHLLMLESALAETGRVLGGAGVDWAPLKGLDLASRVYARAEERPTSDVDVLVRSRDLATAQRALLAAGWTPLSSGRRVERYLREEGYAWQARAPSGILVEVHYRLWGSVATEAGDMMLERAEADSSLGPGGHRLRLADAYVLAAQHLWLDAPPRRLGAVRDLAMISRAAALHFAEAVVASASELDLQLPVALAARWSASLWREAACAEIAEGLESSLAFSERRWLSRSLSREGDPARASYSGMTLARHLARRRTRHGLARLAWRRIWAHPGIVEAAHGDASRSFLLRRLRYQLRVWGGSLIP